MPKGKLTNRTREEITGMSRTRDMSCTMTTREDGACELSFSSEAEIEVWPGEFEVLSHAPGACDLSRMQASGMLLFNHNRNLQLGRISEIRTDADMMGRCVVPKELRSQTDFAVQTWKDIDSGVLQNTSVGYRVIAYTESKRENGTTLYTVTKWQPSEVSFVTVPADISTGVDRAENSKNTNADNENMNPRYARRYQSNRFAKPDDGGTNIDGGGSTKTTPETPAPVTPPVVTIEAERSAGANAERQRIAAISDVCRQYNSPEILTRAISEGLSIDQVRQSILEKASKNNGGIRQASSPLGLSTQEANAFSFVNLIRALVNPQDKAIQEAAAPELEICRAAGDQMKHRSARGTVIPFDVLMHGTRADVMSVGAGTGFTGTGGNLVATELLAGSFIEALRNRTVAMQLGTQLTGLVGNVDIPKQDGIASGGWIGEGGDAPQTDFDFKLVQLRARTAAAYAVITRKMLMQPAIGVEALVRAEIIKGIAQTIDTAAFYGTGADNQPLGVKNYNGLNAQGFAAVNPTFAELVSMESKIAAANADTAGMAYVSHTAFRGYAKTALKFPDTAASGTIWEPGNTVNGYRTEITNQITSGDIFFGNWADMVIGLWGGLDIIVDPSKFSTSGGILIAAFQDVDVTVRRVESLCYGKKTA